MITKFETSRICNTCNDHYIFRVDWLNQNMKRFKAWKAEYLQHTVLCRFEKSLDDIVGAFFKPCKHSEVVYVREDIQQCTACGSHWRMVPNGPDDFDWDEIT